MRDAVELDRLILLTLRGKQVTVGTELPDIPGYDHDVVTARARELYEAGMIGGTPAGNNQFWWGTLTPAGRAYLQSLESDQQ